MSSYHFIASHYPLEKITSANVALLSLKEIQERKIAIEQTTETFKTSDPTEKNLLYFEKESPSTDFEILSDNPEKYAHLYTEKKYISKINWDYHPSGVDQLMTYIQDHMIQYESKEIELWAIPTEDADAATMRFKSIEEVTKKDIEKLYADPISNSPKGLIITRN